MNDLAVRNDDLPALFELAKQLVPTGFLPQHLKTPGQVVAIILAGRELGMPPMRALRSLKMVKGNVTESADSQLGRFKAAGGKAVFDKLDETQAVLTLTHPNGDVHTETFTIADAKRAGLTNNDTYTKYPKPMLRSRAITAGLKSLGWEGGAGVYDPGELIDITPDSRPEPVVQMPRRLSERPKPEPVVERTELQRAMDPELDDQYDPEPPDDLAPQLQASLAVITPAQQKKLFASIRDSVHDEVQFRAWLRESMGLESTKQIPSAKLDEILRRLADTAPLWADYEEQDRELPLAGRPRYVRCRTGGA